MVLNGDDAISTQDLFDSYINGFVLVSDSTKNKAVIGFRAANTSLYLKMYYHFNDQPDKRQETYFAMGTLNHQFNHYRLNLAGTPLSSIKANGNILPSDKTNNEAFMQGITGIMPKVQFPSLPDLFLNQTWNILKAELVIKPAQGTYNIFSLPKNKSLYLYTTNNTNQITGTLMVNSSQYLTATFVNDPVYNENTSYTYDITNYLNNQLSGGFFNTVNGLLIGPSDTKFKTTYDRMVIDTKYPSVYLLIYYLSY